MWQPIDFRVSQSQGSNISVVASSSDSGKTGRLLLAQGQFRFTEQNLILRAR